MAGLVVMEKLNVLGNRFVNGEYLDLENGRVYNCNEHSKTRSTVGGSELRPYVPQTILETPE